MRLHATAGARPYGSKKLNQLCCLLTALLLTVVAAGCGGSDSAATGSTTKIVVGAGGNVWDTPMRLAEQQGYFADRGLDVKFVSLTASTGVSALQSGSVDFLPTSPTNFVSALSKKLPLISVSSVGLGNPLGLIVSTKFAKANGLTPSSSNEAVAKALADSKPGASSPNTKAQSEMFLKAYGVDTSRLDWVTLPSISADRAAIANNQIDWFLTSEPTPSQIAESGDGVVVMDPKKFPQWGSGAGYGLNVVVQKSYADDNSEATKKFVAAVAEASKYISEHPSDPKVVKAAKAVLTGASDNVVEQTIGLVEWSPDGKQDEQTWAATTKFLNELGTVKGGAKVTSSDWTNDYLG